MAYLPPAGKRFLTDNKLSYLPTMTEIDNPAKVITANRNTHMQAVSEKQVMPTKTASCEENQFKYVKKYTKCYAETNPLQQFFLAAPTYHYKTSDVRVRSVPLFSDPRHLPYGLPAETFNVRIRANWFDHWKEQNYRYTGAFKQWENRYGQKYFYTTPKLEKKRSK